MSLSTSFGVSIHRTGPVFKLYELMNHLKYCQSSEYKRNPRFCLLKKLPGDANVACPLTIFQGAKDEAFSLGLKIIILIQQIFIKHVEDSSGDRTVNEAECLSLRSLQHTHSCEGIKDHKKDNQQPSPH